MVSAELSVAQLLGVTERRVGLAFLVGEMHLVTCAHVVNAALGRPARTVEPPPRAATLFARFPLVGARDEYIERRVSVAGWYPEPDVFDLYDVAVLRLTERVPTAPLTLVEPFGTTRVQFMGPSTDRRNDGHVQGDLMGAADKSRLQINERVRGVFRARPGFSGGPAWRPGTVEVAGMLQAVSTDGGTDVYVIRSGVLAEFVARLATEATTHRAIGEAPAQPAASAPDDADELIVEHDDAELRHDNGIYYLTQRRRLFNASSKPVERYLMRIHVERYPYDPVGNEVHHASNPLDLDAVALRAWTEVGGERLPMQADRLFKMETSTLEVWLEFHRVVNGNFRAEYPVYPGERRWIEYTYRVSEHLWGPWFQRNVRLRTRSLSVRLDFPSELEPECRGREISVYGDHPLPTRIQRSVADGRTVYSWSTESIGAHPRVNTRYRLDWYFKNSINELRAHMRLSELMQEAGIFQRGDPILGPTTEACATPLQLTDDDRERRAQQAAKPFVLPREADVARWVVDSLQAAVRRAIDQYSLQGGGPGITGLAAPQIGIDRAAMIVRERGANDFLALLNPRIVSEDGWRVEYEGCLSLFDWRGRVKRPERIEVEHQDFEGRPRIMEFGPGMAAAVSHEIDHLNKVLYDEQLVPGTDLVSVEVYRSGTPHR